MTTTTQPRIAEIRKRLDEIAGIFHKPIDMAIYNQLVAEKISLIAEYRRLDAATPKAAQ